MPIPERVPRFWIAPSPAACQLTDGRRAMPRRVNWITRQFAKPWAVAGSLTTERRWRHAVADLGPVWQSLYRLRRLHTPDGNNRSLPIEQPPSPPALAYDQVRWTMERELQRPLCHVFSSLSPAPVTWDAFSQTHRARLTWGSESVLVRVLRPEAEQQGRQELQAVNRLLRWRDIFTSPENSLSREQILESLRQELATHTDLRFQASAMQRLRKGLYDAGVYVPWVFAAYSTRRLCVWEDVPALPWTAIRTWLRQDPQRAARWSEWAHVDIRLSARHLHGAFLAAASGTATFPQPLDAANLGLLAEGRVCLQPPFEPWQSCPQQGPAFLNRLRSWRDRDYPQLAEQLIRACRAGITSHSESLTYQLAHLHSAATQHIGTREQRFHTGGPMQGQLQLASATMLRNGGFRPEEQWLVLIDIWRSLDAALAGLMTEEEETDNIRNFVETVESGEGPDGETKDEFSMARSLANLQAQANAVGESLRRGEVEALTG